MSNKNSLIGEEVKASRWNRLDEHFGITGPGLTSMSESSRRMPRQSSEVRMNENNSKRHNVNGFRDSRSDGSRNSINNDLRGSDLLLNAMGGNVPMRHQPDRVQRGGGSINEAQTFQRQPKNRVQPSKAIHNIYKTHMSHDANQDSAIRPAQHAEISHEIPAGAAPEDFIGWNRMADPMRPSVGSGIPPPSSYPTAQRNVNTGEISAYEDQEDEYTKNWRPANPHFVTQSREFMLNEEDLRTYDPYANDINSGVASYNPEEVDGYVDSLHNNGYRHEEDF